MNRVHEYPSQGCAPVHLVMLGRPVTGHVQRDTLAGSVSTNATVSTPTLMGVTTRQDSVCAGRGGRVSDATHFVPRVGGERTVQRNASVTRDLAINCPASVSADVEESDHHARSAVPLDSLATAARKIARLAAVLLPTAPATLSQEVAFALPASQVQTAPAPARPVSTVRVVARSAGARTTPTATT